MQYLVYRQEGNLGPFSLEHLQQQVAAGTVSPSDLAWHEGLPQWAPVSQFLLTPASPVPTGFPAAPTIQSGSAEDIRRQYLGREQNVRSIGTYFYFSGGFQIFFAVVILICGAIAILGGGKGEIVQMIVIGVEVVFVLLIGILSVWAAGGFRRLDRSTKVPGIIAAILGLLGFPIGTLVNGWILYLIFSEKSRFVFSDEYRQVIAATPQIKWKTAWWVIVIIGLMILLFVSVVAISVLLALGQQVRAIQLPSR